MITSFILLGLWFAVTGAVRLCGSAFMLGGRKRAFLDKLSGYDQRRYLRLSGLSILLCGLLWLVLGLVYPLSYTLRVWVFVIIGIVATFAGLAENKKFFGRFM